MTEYEIKAAQKTLFPFDYSIVPPDFAAELKEIAAHIREDFGTIAEPLIKIGNRLRAVQNKLKKNCSWSTWLETECGISGSEAYRFIRMAEVAANAQFAHWAKLPVPTMNAFARSTKSVRTRIAHILDDRQIDDIGDAGDIIRAEIAKEIARKDRKAQEIATLKANTRLSTLIAAWHAADANMRAEFMKHVGIEPSKLKVVTETKRAA